MLNKPQFSKKAPVVTPIDLGDPLFAAFRAFGGFDPVANTLTPVQFVKLLKSCKEGEEALAAEYALDCITLAVEEGFIEADNFLAAVFPDYADFVAFSESLSLLDGYWLNDRHFRALFELGISEEDATTYRAISESLVFSFEQ